VLRQAAKYGQNAFKQGGFSQKRLKAYSECCGFVKEIAAE
jgi:hypothetical protein